jgi:hypothetical protein
MRISHATATAIADRLVQIAETIREAPADPNGAGSAFETLCDMRGDLRQVVDQLSTTIRDVRDARMLASDPGVSEFLALLQRGNVTV